MDRLLGKILGLLATATIILSAQAMAPAVANELRFGQTRATVPLIRRHSPSTAVDRLRAQRYRLQNERRALRSAEQTVRIQRQRVREARRQVLADRRAVVGERRVILREREAIARGRVGVFPGTHLGARHRLYRPGHRFGQSQLLRYRERFVVRPPLRGRPFVHPRHRIQGLRFRHGRFGRFAR